jgi:cell division protein FtsL
MSSMTNGDLSGLVGQARARVPRIAEAAVERARLSVVPRMAPRRAGRVPFVTLVSVLLVAGVAGLLWFNTSMQQVSFTATALETKAEALQAQRQGLQMDVDALRNPQRVAAAAKHMGMVPPANPAFIRLRDGKVLGDPLPASIDDSIRIDPLPTRRPKNLSPKPVIEKVPATANADTKKTTHGGAAQPGTTSPAGTKKNR